jgi:hypothetical protein
MRKAISFIKKNYLKIINTLLLTYCFLYILIPVIFGFIEIPLGLGVNPIVSVIFLIHFFFVWYIWPFADIFFLLILIYWIIFLIIIRQKTNTKKSYRYALSAMIIVWTLLAPIGLTYVEKWNEATVLSAKYLLNSAGGISQVKAEAMAFLNGNSDKDTIEFNFLSYTRNARFHTEEDYVTIHLGAFFNMAFQYGFLIFDEQPQHIEKDYLLIWEFEDGVYLYGY